MLSGVVNINMVFICLGSAISVGPGAASGPPTAGAGRPAAHRAAGLAYGAPLALV